MKHGFYLTVVLTIMLVLSACGGSQDNGANDQSNNGETTENQAMNENHNNASENKVTDTKRIELNNVDGEKIGTAELKQTSKGVLINLEAANLPKGTHGFHIHETGKCKAPDFKSAGGHFNPTGNSHGLDNADGPHAGDLPNIEVNENGTVQTEMTAKNVTLKKGEKNSLFASGGTAFVIHAGSDDGQSQPSGDAGKRIACGVISQ